MAALRATPVLCAAVGRLHDHLPPAAALQPGPFCSCPSSFGVLTLSSGPGPLEAITRRCFPRSSYCCGADETNPSREYSINIPMLGVLAAVRRPPGAAEPVRSAALRAPFTSHALLPMLKTLFWRSLLPGCRGRRCCRGRARCRSASETL